MKKVANTGRKPGEFFSPGTIEFDFHLILHQLEFSDGKKEKTDFLLKKVDNVWARNCTNISIALEMSMDVFRASASPYHKRAFLFSDGQANEVNYCFFLLPLLLPLSLRKKVGITLHPVH
jgi:hypothetical protein